MARWVAEHTKRRGCRWAVNAGGAEVECNSLGLVQIRNAEVEVGANTFLRPSLRNEVGGELECDRGAVVAGKLEPFVAVRHDPPAE